MLLVQTRFNFGVTDDIIFDGIGPTQPSDIHDVSGYPVIVFELLNRGYSEKDINKILSGNFLRVWKDVIEIGDSLNHSSIN